jgi:hypothetical protein
MVRRQYGMAAIVPGVPADRFGYAMYRADPSTVQIHVPCTSAQLRSSPAALRFNQPVATDSVRQSLSIDRFAGLDRDFRA